MGKRNSLSICFTAIAAVAECFITIFFLLPILLLATAFAALVTSFYCALLLPAGYALPVTTFVTISVFIGSALYGWYNTQ